MQHLNYFCPIRMNLINFFQNGAGMIIGIEFITDAFFIVEGIILINV